MQDNQVATLAQQIAAAAILKEAGRLAGHDSTSPKVIMPGQIQKAVEAYAQVISAMRQKGL